MRNETSSTSNPALGRVVLPEILFASDVARALALQSSSAARRVILAGRAGPYVRIGRRLAVRRASFLAHLQTTEIVATPSAPGGAS
jgi:hypothetical protein